MVRGAWIVDARWDSATGFGVSARNVRERGLERGGGVDGGRRYGWDDDLDTVAATGRRRVRAGADPESHRETTV